MNVQRAVGNLQAAKARSKHAERVEECDEGSGKQKKKGRVGRVKNRRVPKKAPPQKGGVGKGGKGKTRK